MLKKILIVLLLVFIVIQLIRPKKNISDAPEPAHITAHYNVPAYVQDIMKRACYDCHSDNTRYPWYNNIQPVTWWLNDHISEGKRELNFSQFATYTPQKQAKKLKKVAEEVEKDGMPLDSYLWIHKDAVLSKDEKDALITWAHTLQHQIEFSNNLDTTQHEDHHVQR